MALELIWIFVGIILGVFFGSLISWYIFSKRKWGDRASVLNAKWEKRLAEIEKKYEIQLEKSNTNIEKLSREWQVKYITGLEELERRFKDAEKVIKLKSVSSSRRTLIGKFIEKFIPFLSNIPYEPSDMHFLGQPIDYIVFQGSGKEKIERIIFLEVKTGESKLSKREKSLQEAVQKKRVSWKEIRIDTQDENNPDKEIMEKESSIGDLYSNIKEKIKEAKGIKLKNPEDLGEENVKVICPKCEEEFDFELKDISKDTKIKCPNCGHISEIDFN